MLHSAHTGSHPVPHTHTPTMRTPIIDYQLAIQLRAMILCVLYVYQN